MVLLTLGGFIASSILLATLFPSIARMNDAIASDRAGLVTQTREEVTLVNAFSELDAAATWQDTELDTLFDVWMWVKNTGAKTIEDLDDLDVFVHAGGTSARIPHEDDAGGSFPQWASTVEGGGDWWQDATLKITVHYSGALAAGDYTLEVVTPAGARTIERFTF